MTDPTTDRPTPTAQFSDEELIDALMGAGVLMLAAQSIGDDAAMTRHDTRMQELKAEALTRMHTAAAPDGEG